MHVTTVRVEVDDRVADQLAGSVIRDIAAAWRLDDVHTASCQLIRRREDVVPAMTRADPERDHVRMLQ